MISAIGKEPTSREAGFTLIEIVFALGLIAIATTVVVVNAISMMDRSQSLSAEEIIFEAIQEARFIAAADRKQTDLRYNKETGSLEISNPLGSQQSYPLPEDFGKEGRSKINFYLVPPSEGLEPIEDPLQTRLEAKFVRFAPDRSSTPFVVELDSGRGTPLRFAIDPFSSLERQVAQ